MLLHSNEHGLILMLLYYNEHYFVLMLLYSNAALFQMVVSIAGYSPQNVEATIEPIVTSVPILLRFLWHGDFSPIVQDWLKIKTTNAKTTNTNKMIVSSVNTCTKTNLK